MAENAIEIVDVKKKYRLGEIGGGTLSKDLQSWWARVRHKEDPNVVIGTDTSRYGEEFYALDGINLEIKQGEAVGIIGHNGAGKSTLLKLLSRVTAPTEGEIRIKGRIASMLEVGTGFHGELTGRENIYMNGAILGMTRKEVDSKIDEIIDFSECRQFIDTPVKRYSSGMYVKLAFAVAAHLDAEIMIMDEVLAVGDMKFQKKCLGKMGDEAQGGKTVLYVSHNMATIRQLCTRCIVLNHGKVIFDGDTEKAISLYMQESDMGIDTDYELPISVHDSNLSKKMWMTKIHICNEIPLNFTESLRFRLKWELRDKSLNSVSMRTIVYNQHGEAVAISMTDSFKITNSEIQEEEFEVNTSTLAPGIYLVRVVLFERDDHGTQVIHDSVKGMRFEITEDRDKLHGFLWYKPWGSNYFESRIIR